jgi:hypothetical protein
VDAVVIPSTQDLIERKGAELRAARDKLDAITKRQIDLESKQPSARHGLDALMADKARTQATIERLQDESGILKAKWRAENPLPVLSPEEVKRQATTWVFEHTGGSGEQILSARHELDALIKTYLGHKGHGNKQAMDAMMPEIDRARLKLVALEGRYPETHAPWCDEEKYLAMRKELGVK